MPISHASPGNPQFYDWSRNADPGARLRGLEHVNAADAILTLASLGFLGYGVQPPTAEWGYDVSQAITDVSSGIWWTAFWPGMAIITLVTGLTLVGEGLNDVINPLLRARGAAGKAIAGEAEEAGAEPEAAALDDAAVDRGTVPTLETGVENR